MTHRLRSLLCLAIRSLLVCAAAASACAPPVADRWRTVQGEPEVRIGLLVRGTQATLTFEGEHDLVLPGRVAQRLAPGTTQASALDGRLRLVTANGDTLTSESQIHIHPRQQQALFRYGEHAFRGSVVLQLRQDSLTLVNRVSLEQYLRGVVPWEIGWRKPAEAGAVQAQAIAARTYACKRLGQYDSEGYDLLPDVMDQVYRGTTREDPVADAAILATRGRVLTAGDDLVDAYYSSTCGGHTSRIEEVWDKPAAFYLVGGLDRARGGASAWCATSPHFRWTEAWSGADLQATLEETLPRELVWPAGRSLGTVTDLRIVERDSSGRVHALEIVSTTGSARVVGDRIRWVLRPAGRSILRSILFDVAIERQHGAIVRVVVRGGGNGHGVGMCQVGALEMARRGYDPTGILAHYYPGTLLSTLY